MSQHKYHLHLLQLYALPESRKSVASCSVQREPKIESITNIDIEALYVRRTASIWFCDCVTQLYSTFDVL